MKEKDSPRLKRDGPRQEPICGYGFEAGRLTEDWRSSGKNRIEGGLGDEGLLILQDLMTHF